MFRFFKKKQAEKNNSFDDFPAIGGLMVSKMIVDKKFKLGFMYREKRTRPEDSGWRIFSGHETEEYTNNPSNAGIYNPSTILEIDPSIADLLLKGVGAVYERTGGNKWHKVTDYKMQDDYMVTHKLGQSWTITINNLFERTLEENGDLLYTTGDKSVRLAIWNEEKSRENIYAKHAAIIKDRDETVARTLQTFEFSDAEVARIGYLINEGDKNKNYSVLNGFSITDNQLIQVALYFDDEVDINWAIETWKNIK